MADYGFGGRDRQREPKFLGHDILEHGRVLYVDEENPEDLVYDRFRKLGVDRETAKNIRYLCNAGIRLDKADADVLVEEALDFEPALVVLDSLTRFPYRRRKPCWGHGGTFQHRHQTIGKGNGSSGGSYPSREQDGIQLVIPSQSR